MKTYRQHPPCGATSGPSTWADRARARYRVFTKSQAFGPRIVRGVVAMLIIASVLGAGLLLLAVIGWLGAAVVFGLTDAAQAPFSVCVGTGLIVLLTTLSLAYLLWGLGGDTW